MDPRLDPPVVFGVETVLFVAFVGASPGGGLLMSYPYTGLFVHLFCFFVCGVGVHQMYALNKFLRCGFSIVL